MRPNPHLYEISAWPWLEELSSRAGKTITLATVPGAAWDALAGSGIDCVYLMGVWQRSAVGRLMARTERGLMSEFDRILPGWSMKDVPGSPYSIQAYEPGARIGGWKGLERARADLASRDIALILDFVPNHTGFDHPWIRSHPEFYVQGTLDNYRLEPDLFRAIDDGDTVRFIAHGRDPFFPPWSDVAQLNYFNPATREAMIDALGSIAGHCDGVRCDMAMLVLNDVFAQTWGARVDLLWDAPHEEFWPEATRRVETTYLAEVYWGREYQLQQQGFNFTYDKRLLDRLHHGDAQAAREHLHADPSYSARLARFLENHDEARSQAQFATRLRAAAALTFTLPGLRFFFDGQFEGAEVHAPVQLGRWPAAPDRPDVRDLYTRLLKTIDTPLFHTGEWRLLDVRSAGDGTFADLVACSWRATSEERGARSGERGAGSGERGARSEGAVEEFAVVVSNITDHEAQGLVDVGDVPDGDAFQLADQLADRTYQRSREDLLKGLYVRLGSGDAHLFRVTPRTDS